MGSREFCLPSAISSWIYRTISCHGHLAPSLLPSACCFDFGASAFLSHFVSLSLWTEAYGQLLFYTFTGSVFFVPGGRGAGKFRDKDDFLFQVIDPVVVSGFFPLCLIHLFCVRWMTMPWHTSGGQKLTCGSQFFPSTIWDPKSNLGCQAEW